MKEQSKTTAAGRGVKITTETRRDRWHRHIVVEIERCEKYKGCVPAKWFEEIEGRPMADVICDHLASDRGFGVKNPSLSQKYYAEVDDSYEMESVRIRNNHERENARNAVFFHLQKRDYHIDPRHLRRLIRRFYRVGDCGIDAAIARAVKCALNA